MEMEDAANKRYVSRQQRRLNKNDVWQHVGVGLLTYRSAYRALGLRRCRLDTLEDVDRSSTTCTGFAEQMPTAKCVRVEQSVLHTFLEEKSSQMDITISTHIFKQTEEGKNIPCRGNMQSFHSKLPYQHAKFQKWSLSVVAVLHSGHRKNS
jgi:hypothetical protein